MKISYLLSSALLILPGLLTAQGTLPAIRDIWMHKTGDTVEVSFEIVVQGMRPDEKLTYTPVLYGSDSCLALETLSISRRRRTISDIRSGITGMHATVSRRPNAPVRYRTAVPYRKWMERLSVEIECVLSSCCRSVTLPPTNPGGELLLYYAVIPHYDRRERICVPEEPGRNVSGRPMLYPAEKYADRFDVLAMERGNDSNAVRFRLSSSRIDENRPENRKTLDAITRAIHLVEDTPGIRLKKIFIAGYASPEGNPGLNTALARKRALAIRDYLLRNTGVPDDTGYFEVCDGGEDWKGLRELVAASDMKEKEKILRILDSGMTVPERKLALKSLGAPYDYLLAHFYPALRNAGYVQIYYDTVPAVQTSETGAGESGEKRNSTAEDTAGATVYNEALTLMDDGRWAEARDLLLSLDNDAAALNPLGVCYMMTGDYDSADACFSRAAAEGDADAARNLKETATARSVGSVANPVIPKPAKH